MMPGGPHLAARDHLGCLRRAKRAARRGGIPRGRPGDGEPSTRPPRRITHRPAAPRPTHPGGDPAGAAGDPSQLPRRADERSDVCETPTQAETAPRTPAQ